MRGFENAILVMLVFAAFGGGLRLIIWVHESFPALSRGFAPKSAKGRSLAGWALTITFGGALFWTLNALDDSSGYLSSSYSDDDVWECSGSMRC